MEETATPPVNQNLDSVVEQVIQESPPVKPEKKGIPKSILLVIIFVLLASLIYFAIVNLGLLEQLGISTTQQQETEQQEEEEEMEIEIEEEFTLYQGDTVSAQVPSGWSIVEYYDGEGTAHLAGDYGDFTGLTGLKIFKGDTEIFYIQGIYGIGFAGCPSYAKFEDENPQYYAQIVADGLEMGDETTVTDYTDSEYVEFDWLGTTFRRVERYYNYDTVSGNQYFEPSCVPTILSLEGLEYYPPEGPSAKAYDYGPKDSATLEDLAIVDGILESMALSN